MNTNTDFDKIDKVLSKISGKEMKGFVRQYAATHEDFATALVEKYWKPERGNYKEQVEACFAHAGVLGKRFGQPQLDWRKIEQDLGAMMRKAKSMKKKGNLIDAALIAGYVMTITCREFKHDHLAYTPARYDVWAEKNKVLKNIVNQSADMVRELLINSDEIEEDSRLGMLGEIAEQCEEIGDNYFMRFEWFVDEAMPVLCGDDEKAYLAHISKRLKNKKEKYFHYRYYIQKADYWAAHGKRAKAEKLISIAKDGLADIVKNGVAQAYVSKAKESFLKSFPERQISNGYWMSVIYNYYGLDKDINSEYVETVEKCVTSKNIQKLLKKMIKQGNMVKIVMNCCQMQ